MIVISLSGHIGSGKSYIANAIREIARDMGYNSVIFSFATVIKRTVYDYTNFNKNGRKLLKNPDNISEISKQIYSMLTNETKDLIEQLKNINENIYENENEIIPSLVRKIYQKIGEDVRNKDRDFFVRKVIDYINSLPPSVIDIVIIDDLRFKNEYRLLRNEYHNNYIALYVERNIDEILENLKITKEQYENMLNHISEQELGEIKRLCDAIIHNNKKTNIQETASILLWWLIHKQLLN